MDNQPVRLTSLSHGGGCGCKIAPSVLAQILAETPLAIADPALIVGPETSDDAAVYRIDDSHAIVATTDFFMPIVDDPHDFGRIAAANALSDIYAIGGRPVMALAVVGMPVETLPVAIIRAILAGGAATCAVAGIPVAGGHSIDAPEPIYGLVAIGLIRPDAVKRNGGARAGDVLVLGKALGVGILSAALKAGDLGEAAYAGMLETTTRLNAVGADLAGLAAVHAMTDVTGFGLLGHLLEMCRASAVAAVVDLSRLPVLDAARDLAMGGLRTGAGGHNWDSYGHEVGLPAALPDWQHDILCDPQTNGGLLVSCAAGEADRVLRLFHDQGHVDAAVIGAVEDGPARVSVR